MALVLFGGREKRVIFIFEGYSLRRENARHKKEVTIQLLA